MPDKPKEELSEELKRVLTGAGVGAGVGGLGSILHSYLQGRDLSSTLRRALTGASMGGLAGGGIGYLTEGLGKTHKSTKTRGPASEELVDNAGTTAALSGVGAAGGALAGGVINENLDKRKAKQEANAKMKKDLQAAEEQALKAQDDIDANESKLRANEANRNREIRSKNLGIGAKLNENKVKIRQYKERLGNLKADGAPLPDIREVENKIVQLGNANTRLRRDFKDNLARRATPGHQDIDLDTRVQELKRKLKADYNDKEILEMALGKKPVSKDLRTDVKNKIDLETSTIKKDIGDRFKFRRKGLRWGLPLAGAIAPLTPYAISAMGENAETLAQSGLGVGAAYAANKALDSNIAGKIKNKIPGKSKVTNLFGKMPKPVKGALGRAAKHRKGLLYGLTAAAPWISRVLSGPDSGSGINPDNEVINSRDDFFK